MASQSLNTVAHRRGLAIGSLILTCFGGLWIFIALAEGKVTQVWPFALWGIGLVGLVALSLYRLLTVGTTPGTPDEEAARRGKSVGIAFGVIFSIECAFIAIGAVVLAGQNLGVWIPVMAAFIVGVHFLPLARVFEVPLYYWTGTAMVVWVLGCAAVSDMGLRLLLLGIGVGLVLWLSAGFALTQMGKPAYEASGG